MSSRKSRRPTTPSDTVLDETPGRSLKFLAAVSMNRTVLAKSGYTLTIGPVNAATDVEPLAAQVGAGVVSGVATDFLCAPRSAATPIRGAFEH